MYTSVMFRRASISPLGRARSFRLAQCRYLSSHPISLKPGVQEIKDGHLNDRNLELAVRHLHQDGLVVIEDVVPLQHIDSLNDKMVGDAHILQAKGDDGPFNYNKGNLQQDAPPWAEYFQPSIFANSIGTQVTSTILGPRPRWTFCSGNTAMPPSPRSQGQRQPVHSDADFAHPIHPFALVINVPLVDMNAYNGSTELWLGTHNSGIECQEGAHGERASGRIRQDLLDERRKVRGPTQPDVKKGSIVVRDLRLWHAGMPNNSEHVRVMLAMIHFAPWYRNPMRLEFADDIKPILENVQGIEAPVDWVSLDHAKSSYLTRAFGNSYDFDQAP